MSLPKNEKFKDLFNKSLFSGIKSKNTPNAGFIQSGFMKMIQDKMKQIQSQKDKK